MFGSISDYFTESHENRKVDSPGSADHEIQDHESSKILKTSRILQALIKTKRDWRTQDFQILQWCKNWSFCSGNVSLYQAKRRNPRIEFHRVGVFDVLGFSDLGGTIVKNDVFHSEKKKENAIVTMPPPRGRETNEFYFIQLHDM